MMDQGAVSVLKFDAEDGIAQDTFIREGREIYITLREHGFCILDASRGSLKSSACVPSIVKGVFGPAKRFFALSHDAKQKHIRTDGVSSAGYYSASSNSSDGAQPTSGTTPEHFIVRPASVDRTPEQGGGGDSGPDFSFKAEMALASMHKDARCVLHALAWAMTSGRHPDHFTRLLDRRPLPAAERSSSLLKILNCEAENPTTPLGDDSAESSLKRKKTEGVDERTEVNPLLSEHVDRGLVTVVVQQTAGLEVFCQREQKWVRVPEDACVLLVGHTLEAASAGAFQAVKHRVVLTSPSSSSSSAPSANRLSMTFHIRARLGATVDNSEVPVGIRRSLANTPNFVTVKDVLRRFAATHSSVTGHNEGNEEEGDCSNGQREKRHQVTPSAPPSSASSDNRTILIVVRDMTNEHHCFKVKRCTRLSKLFLVYAERKGISRNAMRFLLDGEFIKSDATPASLDLEDGNCIDCMLEQQGD